jgi:hypothetical protein
MEMVPVGAIVVTVALRTLSPRASWREPSKFGITPRSSARARLSSHASSSTNFITRSAKSRPSSES